MKNKIFSPGFLSEAILMFIVLLVFVSGCSKEKTIGLGENIRHDDFFYSIQRVEKPDEIAGREASGTFYVITFRCQNDAKRVDHEWKNNVAYVTDAEGNEYENNNELQKLLNQKEPFGYKDSYNTQAGTVESTVMVFDVPNSVTAPYLKVRGNILMGDMLDGNQFKKTKVKLF